MLRHLSLAVASAAFLAAGSAHALTGISEPVGNIFTLTPENAAVVEFACSPCVATAELVAGVYSNRYDSPPGDTMNEQRVSFFGGTDYSVINSPNAGPYTTPDTAGIMVKQGISTFFFDYAGAGDSGKINFSFGSVLPSNVTFTPIPAALVLLLTALAGLYGVKRFRRQDDGALPA